MQQGEVESAEYSGEQQYVFEDELEYKCAGGYTTTGKADGDESLKAKCPAAGEYDNVLVCDAVECLAVPNQPHKQYGEDPELVFPEKILVACDMGHALDAHNHDAAEYEISCEADGTLKVCPKDKGEPVSCGGLPDVENAKVEGSDLFGESITVTCDEGHSVDTTRSSESLKVYDEDAPYALDEGVTPNGQPDGDKDLMVTCQEDGTFTDV